MEAIIIDEPDPRSRVVSIERLVPWNLNPRRTSGDLAELTASIREQGILQPPTVRPLRGEAAIFAPSGLEIVSGERRYRAAVAAGLKTIQVIVREDLVDDDETALELNVSENINRVDVGPLEEADGLAAMRKRGRSPEEIAAKLGRHVSYVYGRLALSRLCDEARALLVENEIEVAGARALARLTDAATQRQVVASLRADPGPRPHSFEAVRHYVLAQQLQLSGAPWPLADTDLGAVACSVCPTRTCAQAQLFGETEEDDRCTDPRCYEDKREAYGKRLLAAAKKRGLTLVSASEAKKLYPQPFTAPFDLERVGLYELDGNLLTGNRGKLRDVLGDRLDALVVNGRVAVVRHPHDGSVRELVKVADVKAVFKNDPRTGDPRATKDPGKTSSSGAAKTSSDKAPRASAKKDAAAEKERLVDNARAVAQLRIAGWLVARTEMKKLSAIDAVRFIAEDLVERGMITGVAERREFVREGASFEAAKTAVAAFVATAKLEQLLGLCLELILIEYLPVRVEKEPAFAQRLLDHAGVDWFAIEKSAIADATATPGTCRECGCTQLAPCTDAYDTTCSWVDERQTLCTKCAPPEPKKKTTKPAAPKTKKAAKKSGRKR